MQRKNSECYEMDSEEALKQFIDDEKSLDFIFIDTYMTYEQACSEILDSWYPKL